MIFISVLYIFLHINIISLYQQMYIEVLNETLFEGSTESALLRELGLNEAQRSLTIEEASLEKQIIIEEANALRELVNKK